MTHIQTPKHQAASFMELRVHSQQVGHVGSNTERRAAIGTNPDVLTDIYQNYVNMAIWQRQISTSLNAECLSLLANKQFTGEQLILSTDKSSCLEELLPALSRYPNLLEDMQTLVDMFSCLFDPESIGLRLTPLSKSMCPKFHVDRVPCRLITTYIGAGTEWLQHSDVDRSKLGAGSGGLSDADSGLYPNIDSIKTLSSGDTALLKGESWEGNEGGGLVHRSPTVDTEQRRLLLTLDFI